MLEFLGDAVLERHGISNYHESIEYLFTALYGTEENGREINQSVIDLLREIGYLEVGKRIKFTREFLADCHRDEIWKVLDLYEDDLREEIEHVQCKVPEVLSADGYKNGIVIAGAMVDDSNREMIRQVIRERFVGHRSVWLWKEKTRRDVYFLCDDFRTYTGKRITVGELTVALILEGYKYRRRNGCCYFAGSWRW